MEGVYRFLEVQEKLPLGLLHKVMDRFASFTVTTTLVTYEQAVEFIQGIPEDFKIAKGPCACRLHTAEKLGPDARDLAAKDLSFCSQSPINVDIQIGACGEKFGALDTYEFITKEELLELEKECHNLGLVSNVFMMWGGEAGICHCSSATCVPLMAYRAIGNKTRVIRKGSMIAKTDMDACSGSGACVKVCHFNARRVVEGNGKTAVSVDLSKCYGCGLCAEVCPEGAITLIERQSEKASRQAAA